jgi:hydrogenase-1 operon protein HyaF
VENPVPRLTEIPIRIETSAPPEPPVQRGGLGGGVVAILSELVTLLERLAGGQAPASIDMRSLPMSPEDRSELQRILGDGEVQATFDAQGLSRIRETRVSGVWWVEHFDQAGGLIAEMIEVNRIPDILLSAPDEIAAAARELRAQISSSTAARGADHASH